MDHKQKQIEKFLAEHYLAMFARFESGRAEVVLHHCMMVLVPHAKPEAHGEGRNLLEAAERAVLKWWRAEA